MDQKLALAHVCVCACTAPLLVPGCVAMAPRTEEQLRRRAEIERWRYRAKRLASLKQRFPGIPPDVLQRAPLRQVSPPSAFNPGECSSGPVSNTHSLCGAPSSRTAVFSQAPSP